ncbi:UDP-glucose/GDP-mannose dehydrogenase family protein [Psychrobacter sp. DM8]|uniref:UDP-glucose/GDP-mannose dehydrogenase family protein n=1 Tax=Psychrobacter sp. DM8 TaxID=3440636 RepID=UPI003F4F5D7D
MTSNSANSNSANSNNGENANRFAVKYSDVCVLIGHGIEALTSAVVLASLGQYVHIYADNDKLSQQLQQYSFEHHLQALWQLYVQQEQIISFQLPKNADELIITYEEPTTDTKCDSTQILPRAALYWLFLDDIKSFWNDESWVSSFNDSQQQTQPIITSGIENLGHISQVAQRLRRAWVYYVPFVFLQDGEAYSSMLKPSLWLLGEKTPDSSQHLRALQPLMQQARSYHHADIATIEFARSSIMAMLATRVSFMNEMSRLADSQNVDIGQVSQIMGLDARVGSSYLQAGWGFGGNTLPSELIKLEESGETSRVEMPLLQAVMHINEDQKELIFRKFWQYFDGFIDNKTVMIWGGSYKSGSGRTANSAIHPLLSLLWSYNIHTLIYSDKAQTELAEQYEEQPLMTLINSPYQSLASAQAIFIISWSPQDRLDVASINQYAMPIFDAQNVLTRVQVEGLVGGYVGIGRNKS